MKAMSAKIDRRSDGTTYTHFNVSSDYLSRFIDVVFVSTILKQHMQSMIGAFYPPLWLTIAKGPCGDQLLTMVAGRHQPVTFDRPTEQSPAQYLPGWIDRVNIDFDLSTDCTVTVTCNDAQSYEKQLNAADILAPFLWPAVCIFDGPDNVFDEKQLLATLPDLAGRWPKINETLRLGGFITLQLPGNNLCLSVTQFGDESTTFHCTHTGAPPLARQMRFHRVHSVCVSMTNEEAFLVEGLPLGICRYLKMMADENRR